ncbi:hypothetical protein KQX54_009778 [Cotesia glomerata]|uniref:Uncharacterized protein n=1 Tax=Cotesia glomerata TaxID=32391 RepID=A0AAV7I8D8_COTGL|nr:hypothetical protein KQX54_009778 [Cotesia glomerata]
MYTINTNYLDDHQAPKQAITIPEVSDIHCTPVQATNKPGRKIKALNFTRDRVGSETDIRDFLKRKRDENKELDTSLSDSESNLHPLKRLEIEITELKQHISDKSQTSDNVMTPKSLELLELTNKKLKKMEQLLNEQEKESKKMNIIIKNHNWGLSRLQENTLQFLSEKFNAKDDIVKIQT